MFEEVFHEVLHYAILLFECIGALIIIVGTIWSFINLLRGKFNMSNHKVKLSLTRSLSMSLEFLLAAEVIKTIMAESISELAILGGLVALRIVISVLLIYEIKLDSHELQLEEEKERILRNEKERTEKRLDYINEELNGMNDSNT